jgi:L-asparaginase/Glu-tRNA(Gln) amidotransferase subunit D
VYIVHQALAAGRYGGGLWLEGSPTVEGTVYWRSLLVDTTLPIAASAAHRDRGVVSADGDGNILESVDFILSKVWADERGRNRLGSVMVQDEVIYSAREVQKRDAHPRGYIATGGYGGVLGSMTAGPFITNVPTRKHTWQSEVRMTVLPTIVDGLLRREGEFTRVPVTVKSVDGQPVPAAVPKVIFVKGDHWYDDSGQLDPASDRGIEASINMLQEDYQLAGIVAEGLAPYAVLSASQERALLRAVYRGRPVVKTARGDAHGLVRLNPANLFIEGNNLTATKARLLLTAAIMKLGVLPHATDPEHPTSQELDAIRRRIDAYQQIFQTHRPFATTAER